MRTVSVGLGAHLQSETVTLATCWRVECQDGDVFGFTDHDADLLVDSQAYVASSGFSRTALASNATLAVDNVELDGLLVSAAISEQDVRAGKFDYAKVEIFLVNWADLSQGRMLMLKGRFGEARLTPRGVFHAELRGMSQALSQSYGELYGPECRASLGDGRCKVNLSVLKQSGTVDAVLDGGQRRIFTTAGISAAAGFFDFGLVVWTSGNNSGASQEIVSWDPSDDQCELFLPMGYVIQPGDAFDFYPGCDKRLATCRDRYSNAVNFRGEPHLPGMDKLTEYPID